MSTTCKKATYDEPDCIDICVSDGSITPITFEIEEGDPISPELVRMSLKRSYKDVEQIDLTIANGGILKTGNVFKIMYDTNTIFPESKKTVYDLYGHTDFPTQRIIKGKIIVNPSTT